MSSFDAGALEQSLRKAAALLRLGREGAGGQELTGAIDALWSALSSGALSVSQRELTEILPEVIGAQERGDWLWVADMLEHRLAPLIAGDPP